MSDVGLDPDKISAGLRTVEVGRKVVVFKSTASTNDAAARYATRLENSGVVVFAEQQSSGRGRGGSSWQSQAGKGLLFSVLTSRDELTADAVSLAAAVAVAEAVGKVGRYWARIKWPNDILVNNKKLAGILVESRKIAGHSWFVIGVGINCNQDEEDFAGELDGIATSISMGTKTDCDRVSLAKRLLVSIDEWLGIAATDKESVIKAWKTRSIQLGHRVTLEYNGKAYSGNCIGIDPDKGLILQFDRGGVRMFDAAHATISKMKS